MDFSSKPRTVRPAAKRTVHLLKMLLGVRLVMLLINELYGMSFFNDRSIGFRVRTFVVGVNDFVFH